MTTLPHNRDRDITVEQADDGLLSPYDRCPGCGHLLAQHYVTGECEVCFLCDDDDEEWS